MAGDGLVGGSFGGWVEEGEMGGGLVKNGEGVLVRSPFVLILRLHPACFANACSMWSRNPIPVHIQIC